MTVGQRLRAERERLKLTQDNVIDKIQGIAKVRKQALGFYEKDKSSPNAEFLIELAKLGMDVFYILFGQRLAQVSNEQEAELIRKFRQSPPEVQKFMLGGINAVVVGQQFNGDIHGGQFFNQMM